MMLCLTLLLLMRMVISSWLRGSIEPKVLWGNVVIEKSRDDTIQIPHH